MKAEKIVCPHCGAPIGEIQPGKLYHCEYCGMSTVFSDLEAGGSNERSALPSNEEVTSPGEMVYQKDIPKKVNDSLRPGDSRQFRKPGYWTPVGFRSRKIWKMSVAGIFYSALIYIAVMPTSFPAFGLLFSLFYFFAVQILFGWKPLVDHLPWMDFVFMGVEYVIRFAYIFLEASIFFILFMALTLI